METKQFKLVTLILTLIMAIIPLTTTACSLSSPSEIKIISEQLHYTGGSAAIVAEIKNTTSNTIKVSFNGTIYLNGKALQDVSSDTKTLEPDKTTIIVGSPFWPISHISNYSYKITSWNIVTV